MARRSRRQGPTERRPAPIQRQPLRRPATAPEVTPPPTAPVPLSVSAAVFLALMIPAWLWLAMDGTNYFHAIIGDRRGSHDFYAAAAQVIPTIIVAWVIEMRLFIRQLRRIFYVDGFAVAVIMTNVLALANGTILAITELNCEGADCGSREVYANVLLALVTGFFLLIATMAVAFIGDD